MIPEDSKPGRSGPWFAWLQGQLCANTVPSKVCQDGQNGVVEGAARMGPCSLLWEHPPAWPCEVVRRGWGQRGSQWGVRAVEGPVGLGGGSGTLEVLRNNCLLPSGNGQPSLFSPGVYEPPFCLPSALSQFRGRSLRFTIVGPDWYVVGPHAPRHSLFIHSEPPLVHLSFYHEAIYPANTDLSELGPVYPRGCPGEPDRPTLGPELRTPLDGQLSNVIS